MIYLLFFAVIILGLIVAAPLFVSMKAYKQLISKYSKNVAWLWSILIFLATFALICLAIYYFIIKDFRFER